MTECPQLPFTEDSFVITLCLLILCNEAMLNISRRHLGSLQTHVNNSCYKSVSEKLIDYPLPIS